MHAQVLLFAWLLTGQTVPETQFVPNVYAPGRATAEGDSPALLDAAQEEVELEPVPESSPGVEFVPRSAPAGNSLRMRDSADSPSSDLPMRDASLDERAMQERRFDERPPGETPRTARSAGVSATSFANERSVASLLVRHGLTPPDDPSARIAGQPTSLVSLFDRQSDRGRRTAILKAYWGLSAELAAANWAAEEVEFVAGLRTENGGADQAEIEAARLDAVARWQESKLLAVSAQFELAQMVGLPTTTPDSLPIPRDVPLVTPYHTKFERIFANRTPPAQVRMLAATIPLEYELIEARATAVSASRDSLKEIRQSFEQGTADLSLLLTAHSRLRLSQRSFLRTVRRYNESVAAYALTIGGSVDNSTLVSMLIPSPTGLRSTPAARTANAETAARRSPRLEAGSSAVRSAGDFSPATPADAGRWAPASRPVEPSGGGFGAPPLSRPPTRFGDE